jgi:hypothetical protein
MSDYTDLGQTLMSPEDDSEEYDEEYSSSAYLSEHESDREFVEDDSQPWNDDDFVPESQEPCSEDFNADDSQSS